MTSITCESTWRNQHFLPLCQSTEETGPNLYLLTSSTQAIPRAFLLTMFPQIVFQLKSYNLAVAKKQRAPCEIETIIISRLISVARFLGMRPFVHLKRSAIALIHFK